MSASRKPPPLAFILTGTHVDTLRPLTVTGESTFASECSPAGSVTHVHLSKCRLPNRSHVPFHRHAHAQARAHMRAAQGAPPGRCCFY